MSELNTKLRYWSHKRQRLGKKGTHLEQVLTDVIGVYSAHPSAPLSLFARMASFDEQTFYQLDSRRLAYRVPAMRLSIYMLPKNTAHQAMAATVPPASDPIWEKRYSAKGRTIPKENYADWKEQLLQLAVSPLTVKEIKNSSAIPAEKVKFVLNRMAFEGSLLRIGASSLRSNIISYVSTVAWAKEDFAQIQSDQALAWLAGEYLRAFGPARIKDFQWWAGITAGKASSAVSAQETVDIGNDYLLPAEDADSFESFKFPAEDSLDLLPQWDCYTMGYAPDGRSRFVSSDMQDKIYGALGATGGNALGTVLVNGLAHGSWSSRFKGTNMNIALTMFEKPASQLEKDIESQFNEMAGLLKAKSLEVEFTNGHPDELTGLT